MAAWAGGALKFGEKGRSQRGKDPRVFRDSKKQKVIRSVEGGGALGTCGSA